MLKGIIQEKLYLFALALYWFLHPNRESVLVRREGDALKGGVVTERHKKSSCGGIPHKER